MTFTFTPRNYKKLLMHIRDEGAVVDPNGERTIEVTNAHLRVKNPRDRLVICDGRKVIFPFGIAEWLGMLTGIHSVEFFSSFIDYRRYSTDGATVDGAYGARLQSPKNQVAGVISELSRDSYSRRAIMTIYDGQRDLYGGGGKNTPCTLSMQFLIRRDQLDAITTMRSNDVVWGLNYDLIMFTLMQEYVAKQLDVELGSYYHNDGSLHIYERHWGLIDRMSCEPRWPYIMRPMPRLEYSEIEALAFAYSNVGTAKFYDCIPELSTWSQDLAYAARAYVHRKDHTEALLAYKYIEDPTIRRVMRPWIRKERDESL